MKAKQIRIGNLVMDGHEVEKVNARMISMLAGNHADFDPIPLTEEWLLKFGFEFHVNANCENFYYTKDAFICIRCDEDFEWFRYYNGDFYSEIEYVHQLQNLYFALTGEELTLKP